MAEVAERTLAGMGFELVDAKASGGGRFLTIFIERPAGAAGVTVDDCAGVSRQLARVFEVEGIDYDRLEVSSPGLDRPLRKPADFARFTGRRAEVRMRSADAGGRRKFAGVILAAGGGTLRMAVDGGETELALADVDRARLIPEL